MQIKNIVYIIMITLVLLFSGCSSSYDFEENNYDGVDGFNGKVKVEDNEYNVNVSIKENNNNLDIDEQTIEKIISDIEVVQVYAEGTDDGIINGNADTITVVVRLGSDSDSLKLENLLIKIDTTTGSQTIHHIIGDATISGYNISYISKNGNTVAEGYFSSGDLAEITFLNLNDINMGETATIRLITKDGVVKPVDLITPSKMTQQITYLYP